MKLWDHQDKAIKRFADILYCALLFDTGTGKTLTAIEIIRHKFKTHKEYLKTIIFAPISAHIGWYNEWCNIKDGLYQDKIAIASGSSKQKIKALESEKAKIFITNYEALVSKEVRKVLSSKGFEILICDEAHKLANPQAKRTKYVIEIADSTRYRAILTGSPVLNSQLDLFCQYRILDKNIFGSNFYSFRGKYFYDKNAIWKGKHNYFPDWRPRPKVDAEFNKIINEYSAIAKKEDCLDLPPLVRVPVYVDMTKEQEKIYKDMESGFIAFLEDKACTASLALTRGLRLQQFLCGVFKTPEGETYTIKHNRLNVLKDTLEPLFKQHKVIIWSVFVNTYKEIAEVCKSLGAEYTFLTGQQNSEEKTQAINDFNNNPGVRVIIANQAAGGVGTNLQAADYSIYYSRNFSLEQNLQSEARNYRGGSEVHKKITRIDLVTPNSIDEYMLAALRKKKKLGETLLHYRPELLYNNNR